MVRELFTVVHRQGLDPCFKGLEYILNGLADQLSRFVGHLLKFGIAALAFDNCHHRLAVTSADNRIAFPVTNLLAPLNVQGTLTDGATVENLPTPVAPAQVAFAPGLLAAQALMQFATAGFVGIDVLVHRLMADWQLICNLFRAPFNPQVKRHLRPYPRLYAPRIAAAMTSFMGFAAGLFSTVTTSPTATLNLATDGAAVSTQQAGNLCERVLGFHQAADLVSFFSAEVLVHWATSTWRLKRP